MASPRPLDEQFNTNGARMCDAFGCRRHARLVAIHQGLFCTSHAETLKEMRRDIVAHRGDAREARARLREIALRKNVDLGHKRYAGILARCVELSLDKPATSSIDMDVCVADRCKTRVYSLVDGRQFCRRHVRIALGMANKMTDMVESQDALAVAVSLLIE
jgi:hypothetical protein